MSDALNFPIPFEIEEDRIVMVQPLDRGVPVITPEINETIRSFFADNPHLTEGHLYGDKRSQRCWVTFSPLLSFEECVRLERRYRM